MARGVRATALCFHSLLSTAADAQASAGVLLGLLAPTSSLSRHHVPTKLIHYSVFISTGVPIYEYPYNRLQQRDSTLSTHACETDHVSGSSSASGPLVNCKARHDASSTRRGSTLSAVCRRSPDEASEGECGRQDAQARTVPVWPCVSRGCEHHQGSSQVNARSPSHPQPAPLLVRLSPRSVIMVPVNMAGTWATTAPR